MAPPPVMKSDTRWKRFSRSKTAPGFAASPPARDGEARGEVVFNTSMTGYQEVLTDPSYAGQIVTMTCPEIGNYGVSPDDVESRAPQVAGFIVRDESPVASNWRAAGDAARLPRRATASSPLPTSTRAR